MPESQSIEATMLAYRRKRHAQTLRTGVWGIATDLLMFRRMVTPWLIRVLFVIAIGAAAVSAIYALVAIFQDASNLGAPAAFTSSQDHLSFPSMPRSKGGSPFGSVNDSSSVSIGGLEMPSAIVSFHWFQLYRILAPLLWLLAVRLLCEFCIVAFQINESLTDVRRLLQSNAARPL